MNKGYTLLELVVGISIISVVVVTGIGVFYRSIAGNSRVSLNISLDGQMRSVMNAFERLVLYSKMVGIDDVNRDVCMASSSAYLTGERVRFTDEYGETEIKLVDDGYVYRLASNSSYISSPTLNIKDLNFRWDCGGIYDTLRIEMKASVWSGKVQLWGVENDFSQTILLKNSGSFIN